jgi:hypothetical protein
MLCYPYKKESANLKLIHCFYSQIFAFEIFKLFQDSDELNIDILDQSEYTHIQSEGN